MSHTYCYRCGNMMAVFLPECPHCGAPQDEQSRAKHRSRSRVALLAAVPSAMLGLLAGWLLGGSFEWVIVGCLVGGFTGVAIVMPLYDKAQRRPSAPDEGKPLG